MAVTFDAEHLVNLDLNEGQGVSGPEQAIIRLHQLHASKVLRPAKVHLRLEDEFLLIVNRETNQVVEKLPYPEVEAHDELFVRSVSDRHKNLLLLTVFDSLSMVPPEFFILQFSNTSPVAKEFLEKFKEFKKNCKLSKRQSKGSLLQPFFAEQDAFNEFQAKQAAFATLKYKEPTPHKGLDMCLYDNPQQQQQQPQQQQELLTKYIELMNHCLDDVEEFVARLKVAAKTYQELQDWREQKKSGAHGGGIRMMRSQPPPSNEFYAIFQKIKLAFNILPKLRGHIKNPNAPELAHFLFTPLDLVVEASLAVLAPNEEPIWQRVVSPLFNVDTLRFFDDCLLSQEADLLKSLGTAWNIPSSERDFWLSCVFEVPIYKPTFADGWSASDDVINTLSISIHPSFSLYSSTPTLQSFSPPHKAPTPTLDRSATASEHRPSYLSLDPNSAMTQDKQSPGSLRSHSPSVSHKSNSPNNPPPISNLINLPNQPLQAQPLQAQPLQAQPVHDSNQDEFIRALLSKGSMAYVTLSDRAASNDQELDVKKGEAFEVLESNRLHSKVRASSGLIGYVPSNILQPLSTLHVEQLEDIGMSKPKSLSAMDHLNREFQHKLIHQPYEPPKKREIVATVAINEKSSPQDVNTWLVSKGFDEKVQASLASFGGKQLFVMDKRVLERLFGVEVGGRLFSQVLVQRNKSGYKTMRANELNALLEGRKKKAESVLLTDVFQPKLAPKGADDDAQISEHF